MTGQPVYSPIYGTTGYEGRSVENPAVPLSQAAFEDDFFYDAMVGPKTASGVRVSRRKALGYSAVWRAVNLISSKIAALPFKVFRTVGPGKEVDRKHPVHRLLHRRPNEWMGPMIFKQTLLSHALLRGNGYAYIFRDSDARPVEMLPLNCEATWPIRREGQLWYVTEVPTGDGQVTETRRLRYEDVIHLRGLGFDGLVGYDVISILRETLGKAIATREHSSRFFSNNARPSVALEFPMGMKDNAVDNVVNRWGRMNQGLENAHKIAILREGVKLNTYSMNARDSQLIENLTYDTVDIANIYGLPPRKLGIDQGGGYNSLFEENQSVHDDTLDPWIAKWEEECDAKLLTEEEQRSESHSCQFVRNAVMRSNPDQRANFYAKMVEIGAMNMDEVRANEDLNPLPDGLGQKFFIKAGMTPLDAPPEPVEPDDSPASEPPSDAARAWLSDAVVRMARRLANVVQRKGSLAEHVSTVDQALRLPIGHISQKSAARSREIAQLMADYASKQEEFGSEYEQKCVEITLKTLFPESESE